MTQPQPIRTLHDAERRHRGHWFDADTMRAFGSRVVDDFMPAAGGARSYFTSSERDRYSAAPRRHTVRVIDWRTGSIDEPAGETFGGYASRDSARKAAARHAATDTVGEFAYPCPTHGTKYAREISERSRLCYACAESAYTVPHATEAAILGQAADRRAEATAR